MKRAQYAAISKSISRFLTPNTFLRKARLSQKLYYYTVLGLILLVGGGVFLWQSIHPGGVAAAWFNDNWAYRKTIAITSHTSAEQNVYINLSATAALDTSDSTRFQSDCGDLRFTNQSGDILPYYIVSGCGTATTVVHVFLKSFPAGAQTIYFYYGNPTATNGFSASDFLTEAANYVVGSQGTEERSTSPSLYYKFDEGFGNVASDSGSFKLHGGIFGPTWQTKDMCAIGNCLFFDGTNDNVNVGDRTQLEFSNGNDFTISLWIRSPLSGTGTLLAKKAATTAGNSGYMLNLSSAGALIFYAADGVDQYQLDTGAVISANTWYQVTLVYDDDSTANTAIYVNGNKVPTTATGTLANVDDIGVNTREVKIGSESDDQAYFKGFLDDVKIYGSALSAAQIKANFTSQGEDVSGSALGVNDQNFLTDGLVGYWRMDEASANQCSGGTNDSCDSSGNVNDGAWGGNATSSSSAKFGAGVTFDGTGDYIDAGTPSTLTDISKRTWAAWIKPLSGGENNLGRIIDKRDYIAITPSGQIQYQMRFSTTDALYQTGVGAVSFGQWTHIVVTYDTTSTKNLPIIYINGVKKSASLLNGIEPVGTHSSDSGFTQYIGNAAGLARSFDGVIDEARVYNRILSPLEVEKLYNFAPSPVGDWKFEEGQGASANDTSGYGNNGRLINSPLWIRGKYGEGISLGIPYGETSGYVQIADSPSLQPGNLTMEAWIYPTSSSMQILQKGNGSHAAGTEYEMYWFPGGPNQLDVNIRDGTNSTRVLHSMPSSFLNSWHYVAATYESKGYLKVYVDGLLVDSTWDKLTGSFNTSNTLLIGANQSGSVDSAGKVDDVKIYNYVRTPKQIVEDMNAEHPAVGSPIGSALGYWKFDEGYGTTLNNSGNQGSAITSAINSATWNQEGKYGKSLTFDGASSYVSFTGSSLPIYNPTAGYSVSFWVNGSSGQTDTRVFSEGSTSSNTPLFNLGTNSSGGYLDVFLRDDSNNALLNHSLSTGVVFDNTWHHVVWTDDNGTAKVYIDGKKDPTNFNYTPSSLTLNRTAIGAILRASASNFFQGKIDEMKVYNFVLSPSEIQKEYNHGSSLVLGSLGISTNDGRTASNSSAARYCVPGGTTTSACQPVGEWNFESKTGTTTQDTSGNAATVTLRGNTTYTRGEVGNALSFDGAIGSIAESSATVPLLQQTGNISVSFWFKARTITDGGTIASLRGGGETEPDNEMWLFQWNTASGNDILYQHEYNAGTNENSTFNTNLQTNTWYFLSMTRNTTAKTVKLYINGRLVGTFNYTNNPTGGSTANLRLGSQAQASSSTFNGIIDQVRQYNYELSPAQVAWTYNRGRPVAQWKFDECQGSSLYDSSGNGNTATINISSGGTQTAVGTCSSSGAWANGLSGKYNYSLNFDGNDDNAAVADPGISNFDLTGSLSISAWVKRGSLTQTSYGIVTKGNVGSGTTNATYGLFLDSTDKFQFRVSGDGSTYDNVSTTQTYADTNWHNVVAVYSAVANGTSSIDLYVDGKKAGVQSTTAPYPLNTNNVNLTIGSASDNSGVRSWPWKGQIDDLQIFNYPLTDYQVKLLYNQSSAVRFGPSSGTP